MNKTIKILFKIIVLIIVFISGFIIGLKINIEIQDSGNHKASIHDNNFFKLQKNNIYLIIKKNKKIAIKLIKSKRDEMTFKWWVFDKKTGNLYDTGISVINKTNGYSILYIEGIYISVVPPCYITNINDHKIINTKKAHINDIKEVRSGDRKI